MALPTDPSLTTLTTEAWKACGVDSPSSAQLTRAQDEWLQEVLNDIWLKAFQNGDTRLRTLQETLIDVSVDGQGYLDLAVGFDEEVKVTVLKATHTGTATGGAASTITLAADEDITAANAEGKYILITSGTGVDGYRQITDYNATTMVATVDSAWATQPVSGSKYAIIDSVKELDEVNITEMDGYQPKGKGVPSEFAKYDRKLIFDCAFDASTYGIQIRYFLNPHEIDLTSTRFTAIMQNWQSVLKQGLIWKCMRYLDDARQYQEKKDYDTAVAALLIKELPYGGELSQISL